MSLMCGWCLTGQHAQCIKEFTSTLTGVKYACPCPQCQGTEKKPAKPAEASNEIHPVASEPKQEETPAKLPEATKERVDKRSGKKGGRCLCCGEVTKGGKFLPGHDSRYLSEAVAEVREHNADPAEVEDRLRQAGCTDAFVGKFQKRVLA